MLKSIHFLLTYTCLYECDHCFLYCSPRVSGTFTLEQLRNVFSEIKKIKSIDNVCFEGGEPFLYYPLLLESIRLATKQKLRSGIVSNAYWATDVEDAGLWLKSMLKLNIDDISVSDDAFHSGDEENSPAKKAYQAAKDLGFPVGTIRIDEPVVKNCESDFQKKGEPVIGGNVKFKGRAAELLTKDLPTKRFSNFKTCPYEELEKPGRVHVDSFGHVHVCQGISIGNIWKTPLSQIDSTYSAEKHPICGPLLKGGPAQLAKEYNIDIGDEFVDECHFCFYVRKALLDRFPEFLAPKQVYGIE
ncbi:MAG: radical SAM protein [candidate division Zixibacteria bacterium]|nr:radical SAM protein [candidate division Zixibacteria bacterium]